MLVSKVYEMPVDAYGDVRTLVRGLPYQCPDDWEEVLDSLDENSELYIVKEPDNPKDKLAISAYLNDRRVGYVAASDNGKIWLYLTDEKMPCKFIERFDASFKISFESPRTVFENRPLSEIYRDKQGISDRPMPSFDIPFLQNPKDEIFNWFDDKILIADLENYIPDFRRKLASRMIIMVGRKNKKAEYCYYLPYQNRPVAHVEDGIIQGLIDRYGFVIALPDVPKMTDHNGILMDLHVTYLKTDFKAFDKAHHSQLVFKLDLDYPLDTQKRDTIQTKERSYTSDSPKDNKVSLFNQPFSLPTFSKEDFVLKNGESINHYVDKGFYDEIDKLTTDLYKFVRESLFLSTELFSYMKKQTPYAMQFFNFGEFETLIRVFVIKDIGSVYCTLGHSINYDTLEGKIMLLYIEKEAGETPNSDYERFVEVCNPSSRNEAVTKMRGLLEKFTESFYEYDLPLCIEHDFVIHSFLTGFDYELADKYMKLMQRFASAIHNVQSESPLNKRSAVTPDQPSIRQSPEETKDYIETYTSSQAAQNVEKRIISEVNKFMSGDSATPYKVLVIPIYGICKCTTLEGEDVAIISDHEIIELADKNNGVYGYITKFRYDRDGDAWYTIRVSRSIPGIKTQQDLDTSDASINDFFPIFGITLSETTWKQAEDMGYNVEIWKEGPSRYTNNEKVTFWDFGGKGIFTSIAWSRSYNENTEFPPLWLSKGFSWNNSYDEWLAVFRKLGFDIDVTQQPTHDEFYGHKTLSARFEVLSSDGMLSFKMNFDYGEDGYLTSSPKTLYSIDVTYKGLVKREENAASAIKDFFPVFGITLGESTWKQAEATGNKVEIYKDGPSRLMHIKNIMFWDYEGMGVFTSLYWTKSYNNTDFPDLWKSKGFSWDNSYDEWMDVFNKLGYNISVKQQPSQKEFSGRNTLSAKFIALSSDGSLSFELIFDYGDNGYYTSSPETLNTIVVRFE